MTTAAVASRSWQQSVRCQTLMRSMVATAPRSTCHHAGLWATPESIIVSAPASVCVHELAPQAVAAWR